MPSPLTSAVLLALTLLTTPSSVVAVPANSYPLALQHPPIVKYGQQYSYQLAPDTYTSSVSQVSYNATDLPQWLSFDSESRTLSGNVPSKSDSDPESSLIWFTLVGSDSEGSTAVNSSLFITSLQTAKLSEPTFLESKVSTELSLKDPSSVVLIPQQPFSLKFSHSLFDKPNEEQFPNLYYMALTRSHTPLPIWISFNSDTLELSGVAPHVNSDVAPSQVFPLSLLAIQQDGFSSASADFNLVLGAHPFYTNVSSSNVTVTPGSTFSYELPLDKITLDSAPLSTNEIASVSVNDTTWIKTEKSRVHGDVPDNFKSTSYLVTIKNNFQDEVSILLNLRANSTDEKDDDEIFGAVSSPLNINATTEEFFVYALPKDLIKNKDADILVDYEPPAPWITFHKDNSSFTGMVPVNFKDTKVTLTGELEDGTKQTFDFGLKSVQQKSVDSSEPTSTSSNESTATEEAATATASEEPKPKSNKKLVAILCGVLIPIGVILILLALFLCCQRRSLTNKKKKTQISNPILPEKDLEDHNSSNYNEKSDLSNATDATVHTSNSPPILPPSLMLPSHHSSFYFENGEGNQNTPVGATKKEWESPSMANEYNMFKLDNPKALYGENSPTSNFFSEGESSDATQVADGDGGFRSYNYAASDRALLHSAQASPQLTHKASNFSMNHNNNSSSRLDPAASHTNLLSHQESSGSLLQQYKFGTGSGSMTGVLSSPSPPSNPSKSTAPVSQQHNDNNLTDKNTMGLAGIGIAATTAAAAAAVATSSKANDNDDIRKNVKPVVVDRNAEDALANPPGQTINSWRQTYEPGQPWHSRKQGGSLATIATDELYSVRLVGDNNRQKMDSDSIDNIAPPNMPSSSHSYHSSIASSNKNRSLNEVGREPSSPILHRIGSSVSSVGSSDYQNSINNNQSNKLGQHSNNTSIGSYSSSDPETQIRNNTHHHRFSNSADITNSSNLQVVPETPYQHEASPLPPPQRFSFQPSSDSALNSSDSPAMINTPTIASSSADTRKIDDTPNAKFTNNGAVTTDSDPYEQYKTASSGTSFYEGEDSDDSDDDDDDAYPQGEIKSRKGRWATSIIHKKNKDDNDSNVIFGQAIDTPQARRVSSYYSNDGQGTVVDFNTSGSSLNRSERNTIIAPSVSENHLLTPSTPMTKQGERLGDNNDEEDEYGLLTPKGEGNFSNDLDKQLLEEKEKRRQKALYEGGVRVVSNNGNEY